MSIYGITGAISTGKTFVADYLISLGYTVFDADNLCRRSYYDIDICKQIYKIFPNLEGILGDQLRDKISQFIFQDLSKLKLLENIIQPYIRSEMQEFIDVNKDDKFLFLDIPLLFENKMEDLFDKIIVTDCSEANIYKRLISRGYDEDKIKQILAKQIDKDIKREKASCVINTDNSEDDTFKQVNYILQKITT